MVVSQLYGLSYFYTEYPKLSLNPLSSTCTCYGGNCGIGSITGQQSKYSMDKKLSHIPTKRMLNNHYTIWHYKWHEIMNCFFSYSLQENILYIVLENMVKTVHCFVDVLEKRFKFSVFKQLHFQ